MRTAKNICLFLLVLSWFSIANAMTYSLKNVNIISLDGQTKINGSLFKPKTNNSTETFPTVIFINSWMMEKHEYLIQAHEFAKAGYNVLSYSARGWGQSDGVVNCGGEDDMNDMQAILDWLPQHTQMNDQIGVAGISYGGGIALMSMVNFPQIKTVAAMSTWADLFEAFYKQETPRMVWSNILLTTGYLSGKMDPIIKTLFQDMKNNKNIDALKSWADKRSAINFVDIINTRSTPTSVYINANMEDELFQPNGMMHFFEKLDVKKHMDISQGIHASAEMGGLLGLANPVWKNVHQWFDEELKDKQSGFSQETPVVMSVKFNNNEKDSFESWPSRHVKSLPFYLGKKSIVANAALSSKASGGHGETVNTIYSNGLSGMTSGIPIVGPIFEAHFNLPVYAWLPGVNKLHGVYYQSEKISKSLKIRGVPKIHVAAKPSEEQMELVAYLYDVDNVGLARLITHGPITLHQAKKNAWQEINFDMVATSYDLPSGHALALGFDTQDMPYGKPAVKKYKVSLKHVSPSISLLDLPTHQA